MHVLQLLLHSRLVHVKIPILREAEVKRDEGLMGWKVRGAKVRVREEERATSEGGRATSEGVSASWQEKV